ncbi:dipeptidase [Novosphingobium sp. 2580]|uniref:Dipeptidase n=2 Tax=Novosphingobium album (ex Hu et al. 2023) TaxID=2930093 RepID=A0ABT0B1X4_9SPHN|nr:dipeptidase [Novosphingobium album (ex Hu et al. 2023)]MCJ2179062.1 dipeptidase [Novosphingobium album (ex Hu et al. 2023)]
MAFRLLASAALLLPLQAAHAASDGSGEPASPEVVALQRDMITLDTHLDTPETVDRPDGWSIMDWHDVRSDYSQVDLPRMKAGEFDGGFWAIYTPQGPLDAEHYAKVRDFAVMRGMSIRLMVASYPDQFELALKADDAARINAEGKRIVYMSIENAYPLGMDVSMLKLFYKMGVRETGFAHFRNNQFADSSTDPDGPKWHGLSPLGLELLAEANKLGMIIDGSHSSDEVLDQLIAKSTTPVVLSHSGCKAIYDNPRNVDDNRLRALAAKGGVIQINSYGGYLRARKPNPERAAAAKALSAEMGDEANMTAEQYSAMLAKRREIDAKYPETDKPTFDDFMKHLLHALQVVGPDHVGIGMDWDGGGGVVGLEDVSGLPKITAALLKAGYSKDDVAKIWGGNVLRVLRQVEAAADPKAAE